MPRLSPATSAALRSFAERASEFAALFIVAVEASDERPELVKDVRSILAAWESQAVVLAVAPWDGFAGPLNAILLHAGRQSATHVLFQSVEVHACAAAVQQLVGHMGPDTLVAGAALPGHAFEPGTVRPLDGLTVPWNTFALWDARKLARCGFLAVCDGCAGATAQGVEEVSTATLLQQLYPEEAAVKLVRVAGVEWACDWADPERQRQHEAKMKSKLARGEAHLAVLKLRRGSVQHIG